MKNRLVEKFSVIKEHKNFGFVKSFAVLLLAIVLFVTSVLAWFATSDRNAADGLSVNLKKGNDITVERDGDQFDTSFYIPAATKPKDDSVLPADLAKAIVVKSYHLTTTGATKIIVRFGTIPQGIMCYCYYTSYRVTSTAGAADLVKNGTLISASGSEKTVDFEGHSTGYLNIVYIADYEEFGNNLNSNLNYSSNNKQILMSLRTTS